MLDIIFISYDECIADKNFAILKQRFPHARRINGIDGIANAHIAASKKSNTRFFYVVDADAEVLDTFDFSYVPTEYEKDYVHIWPAINPAINEVYGYGGVKLFSNTFFREIKTQLDFSTTLTKDIKIMDEPACITHFNSDAIRAFRGAFREAAKLFKTSNNPNVTHEMRHEAKIRLWQWLNPVEDVAFRKEICTGAAEGVKHAQQYEDILFINDHKFMTELATSSLEKTSTAVEIEHAVPNVLDTNTNPWPNNDMKQELLFITKIASALYDQSIMSKLPLTELRDALSDGQLLSKSWLVEQASSTVLPKFDNPKIVILGGWIGTLALMFFARDVKADITSVDIDDRCNKIANAINRGFTFNAVYGDMYELDYSQYDVIINTASEHIEDITAWKNKIPKDKIVIVQNTDYKNAEGHVSTMNNSSELRDVLNFEEVLYEGTKVFPQYKRFMVIGKT